jgi:hypothetical protein
MNGPNKPDCLSLARLFSLVNCITLAIRKLKKTKYCEYAKPIPYKCKLRKETFYDIASGSRTVVGDFINILHS